MIEFTSPLMGAYHRGEEAREIVRSLAVGAKSLTLTPEPYNPYDPNAVMIFEGDLHLGYLAKEIAAQYAEAIAAAPSHSTEIIGHQTELKPVLAVMLEVPE